MKPKYPHISVTLTDRVDGNAHSIVGAVARAMRDCKVPRKEIDEFRREALSGDYQHVWDTAHATVDVI